jgi:thiol-disulfide isomerase/thioredoxin
MAKFISLNNPSLKLPTGGDFGSDSGFFSRVKSSVGNLSTTTLIIIVTILVFSGLSIFYYFYYIKPGMKVQYSHNSEESFGDSSGQGTSNGKNAELLFFFADWCPHCKAAKPIWNELKTEYENKTINGYQVVFTEIDCSNETTEVEQMMNKYNVEGYPTIKLLKDGQVVEYDAKPSNATLTQFLNSVL